MNHMTIKPNDIANGEGVRVSLFVSGCPIHCKGCFNPEAQDFAAGQPFTETAMSEILHHLEKDEISGLSILGGEPLCPENIRETAWIVLRAINALRPDQTIWLYTGYTLEQLAARMKDEEIMFPLLCLIDVLVDGEFREEEKDLGLQFRGSANQRLIRDFDLDGEDHVTTISEWKDPYQRPGRTTREDIEWYLYRNLLCKLHKNE